MPLIVEIEIIFQTKLALIWQEFTFLSFDSILTKSQISLKTSFEIFVFLICVLIGLIVPAENVNVLAG